MTILKAKGLHCHYEIRSGFFGRSQRKVHAVHGVDLELQQGEMLALVGESGCGKSTLGRVLMGLEPIRQGRLELLGEEVTQATPSQWRPLRRQIQMIFQDPYGALNPRLTIFEAIAEPMRVHGICPPSELKDRVGSLLERVGMPPSVMDRFPHAFSGGQRQRICIARALALEPKVLVCDEMVSALDVSVQAQILELLQQLQKEFNLSLVFISHDLAVVRNLCHRVAVMYLGEILEIGPVEGVFSNPHHPYTRALLDAIPTIDPTRRPKVLEGELPSNSDRPAGCSFQSRCAHASSQCSTPPVLPDGHHRVACHHPLVESTHA